MRLFHGQLFKYYLLIPTHTPIYTVYYWYLFWWLWPAGGFWCHEDSPLIHPVGWARRIGQTIDAPPAYLDRCGKGLRDKDDATEDLFPLPCYTPPSQCFREGMKLEAVDPLNLSAICVATIMRVSLYTHYIYRENRLGYRPTVCYI